MEHNSFLLGIQKELDSFTKQLNESMDKVENRHKKEPNNFRQLRLNSSMAMLISLKNKTEATRQSLNHCKI
jgi:hypothetical protein